MEQDGASTPKGLSNASFKMEPNADKAFYRKEEMEQDGESIPKGLSNAHLAFLYCSTFQCAKNADNAFYMTCNPYSTQSYPHIQPPAPSIPRPSKSQTHSTLCLHLLECYFIVLAPLAPC